MTVWWVAIGQSLEQGQGIAFIVTLAIFVLVLLAIGLRWMRETTAALLGAMAIWLANYVGGSFFPTLRLINLRKPWSLLLGMSSLCSWAR